MATLSPTTLARVESNGVYERPPHIAATESRLLALAGRKYRYLMVNMPPGHGKSLLISKYFPAWYLGTFPTHKVILASYGHDYAKEWGGRVRDTMIEYGPLFGVEVRPDMAMQDRWELTAGGSMVSTGVGGTVTGRRADLLIIDDPHKNSEEALSATMRQKVWDTWQSTLFTRLRPGGIVVVVQTRWHEDDLSGRLLAESGLPWEVLSLPAIAGDHDALGRLPGEALWPQLHSVTDLESIKRNVGSFWWAALYQQNPVPLGETIFRAAWQSQWREQGGIYLLQRPGEAIARYVSKSKCARFGTMDLAASTKENADYTVLSSWAITPRRELLLLDIDRRRLEGPDQPAMIRAAIEKHGLSFVGVESVSYQLTLLQAARRQGLPIKALKADKDKLARALSASAYQEGGHMYFPAWAPWLSTYLTELYSFPSAKHDDQVDATAYAAIFAGQMPTQGTA